MAINFPAAPSLNQTFTAAGVEYRWNGSAWVASGTGSGGATPAASETTAGLVELATAAETTAGTDNSRAVHPAGLKVELDKKAPLTAPTFSGAVTMGGSVRSGIQAVAALDIDCSQGNVFTKTVTGNSTFTVSQVPAGCSYSMTLKVVHSSGTIGWFAGVKWPGGSAPSPTAGKTHLFMFHTDDGGSSWLGSSLLNYTT